MIDYYRDLFHRHQWLEDGLCWTVVQPLDPELNVVSDTRELDAAVVSIGDYAVGDDAGVRNRPRLALTHELAARVQRVRMFGSAAIDLAWVAHGRTDALVMLSNNPWDTAAGVVIAREAGAAVVDADGGPHTMTSRATIAAAPELVAELVGLLARAHDTSAR